MTDKDERRKAYKKEYYEKNKEEEKRKARERYLIRKEKEPKKEKRPVGRPRKYKTDDDDNKCKKIQSDKTRVQYYIKRVGEGIDFDIDNMTVLQKQDLLLALLLMKKNERTGIVLDDLK